jgi:hypothetical protein
MLRSRTSLRPKRGARTWRRLRFVRDRNIDTETKSVCASRQNQDTGGYGALGEMTHGVLADGDPPPRGKATGFRKKRLDRERQCFVVGHSNRARFQELGQFS